MIVQRHFTLISNLGSNFQMGVCQGKKKLETKVISSAGLRQRGAGSQEHKYHLTPLNLFYRIIFIILEVVHILK